MPSRALFPLLLLCGLALASPPEQGADALIPPIATPPGWELAEGPAEYDSGTLFEYINGAARMYLSYGFTRLTHLRYALPDGNGSTIDLDIYDMGSELGAYGIYSNGRPADAAARPWGSEGFRSGEVAVAWKGRVYVHARANGANPELLDPLVAGVVRAAPGEAARPDFLQLLPAEGLIRNSDRYVARDLLGHAFLPGGMLARYEVGEELLTLFFCELETAAGARQAVAKLRAYEEREGSVVGDEDEIGDEGFRAEDPGLGRTLVTRSGRYAVGIFGGSSDTAARRILARIVKNLS